MLLISLLVLLDDVLLDDVLLDELLLVALANRSASENPVLLVDELLAEEAPSIKISISKPVPLADELELDDEPPDGGGPGGGPPAPPGPPGPPGPPPGPPGPPGPP